MEAYSKITPETAEELWADRRTIFIRSRHQDIFFVPRKYYESDEAYNAQFKDVYKVHVFPKGIHPCWQTIYNYIKPFYELPEGVM